jgi:hypothetical protein
VHLGGAARKNKYKTSRNRSGKQMSPSNIFPIPYLKNRPNMNQKRIPNRNSHPTSYEATYKQHNQQNNGHKVQTPNNDHTANNHAYNPAYPTEQSKHHEAPSQQQHSNQKSDHRQQQRLHKRQLSSPQKYNKLLTIKHLIYLHIPYDNA